MGTHWGIKVLPIKEEDRPRVRQDIEAAFAEVARVESVMSEWKTNSPISAVNAAAGGPPVPVPAELIELVRRACQFGENSEGAFDVTWCGLSPLWRLESDDFTPPFPKEIEAALSRVNYRKIIIEKNRLGLAEPGMAIGLGGIAKGYGIDRAAAVLRAAGHQDFFIEGGGDILTSGSKHGQPWRIGIQHPRKTRDELLAVAEIYSGAVVSSGDYERGREINGVRYHHILDPRSGQPARLCQAVTVIAPTAETADALATAVFVLGPGKGLDLIRRHPGVEALVVDAVGALHTSEGFRSFAQFLPE